ncbi:MAG: helix-turn-helix transcriptional regulator [Nitrospira sp.]|nr:helix-turn-helix transcriptional regulator [Nitrospira sp.]
MDQKDLAKAVGVIHQRLRRWEQGSEIPDEGGMRHIERMCRLSSTMLSAGTSWPDSRAKSPL